MRALAPAAVFFALAALVPLVVRDAFFLDSGSHPHHTIDRDFDVVFGNHRLRFNIHRMLTDIADTNDMDERDLKSQPWHHKSVIFTQGFLDAPLVRA